MIFPRADRFGHSAMVFSLSVVDETMRGGTGDWI